MGYSDKENDAGLDPFSLIYKAGQWRVNNVSPMHDLQYSAVKQKQYAAKIKQALNTETVIASDFNVTFEQSTDLRDSKDAAPAIVIKVLSKNSGEKKCLYAGILMSWGVTRNLPLATYLPFYLDKGNSKINQVVKKTLSTMFDCQIQQYNINQQKLLIILFEFVEMFVSVWKSTELCYSTGGTDNVSIGFETDDIYNILKSYDDLSDRNQQIIATYHSLQNLIYHGNKVDITPMNLTEFNLANKVRIKSNGTISMKTPEAVKIIFNILNKTSNFKY